MLEPLELRLRLSYSSRMIANSERGGRGEEVSVMGGSRGGCSNARELALL